MWAVPIRLVMAASRQLENFAPQQLCLIAARLPCCSGAFLPAWALGVATLSDTVKPTNQNEGAVRLNGHFAVRLRISLPPPRRGGQSGDNSRKAGIPAGIRSFAASLDLFKCEGDHNLLDSSATVMLFGSALTGLGLVRHYLKRQFSTRNKNPDTLLLPFINS